MTEHHLTSRLKVGDVDIWIVEDKEPFRLSLEALLNTSEGMRCTHSFETCEEAIQLLEKSGEAPVVVLMDIGLPGMDGIEGMVRIKQLSPATDVIMLTIHEEDVNVFRAICAGANGYLLKEASGERIIESINEVLSGGAPMNPRIAVKVLTMFQRFAPKQAEYELTGRELEVLRLAAGGASKRVIAEKLFISYFTVDTHLKNIYSKLQVHSRTEAVAKALTEGIL